MAGFSRMPRYDIRNDGAGPYAIFYCDICEREFRSQPDIASTITKDIGRDALSGFLRKVPIVGAAVADNVVGEDPRYSYKMTPAQVETCLEAGADALPRVPNLQPGGVPDPISTRSPVSARKTARAPRKWPSRKARRQARQLRVSPRLLGWGTCG